MPSARRPGSAVSDRLRFIQETSDGVLAWSVAGSGRVVSYGGHALITPAWGLRATDSPDVPGDVGEVASASDGRTDQGGDSGAADTKPNVVAMKMAAHTGGSQGRFDRCATTPGFARRACSA
jgi:hypothetical protein